MEVLLSAAGQSMMEAARAPSNPPTEGSWLPGSVLPWVGPRAEEGCLILAWAIPPQVERVSHPLLQQQYELYRERLLQRCERRPVEQVLYHGTTAPAVPDICAHGFNRSFCGRNGEA